MRLQVLLAMLLLPLTSVAEKLTYYDCMNPDGSMSYRVVPCDKGQREVQRRSDLSASKADGASVRSGNGGAVMGHVTAINAEEAVRQDFEAAEVDYKLGQYADAAVLYRKAAERGYAPAQFGLGVLYDIGRGVAQDYRQALEWYGKAAEQGYAKAQNNLGFMYSQGKGTVQDYVTAHMWFNIAAARGYDEARRNRGYVQGVMTPEQLAEAQQRAGDWMKRHH